MSQLLAAKAASAASSPAKATLAAARKNDCFATVFDQARKSSRQERRTNDRADALASSRSRDRSARADESGETDGTAGSRSREARDAEPSRTERLQDAAEDARAEKQASAESANKPTEARQEAKPQAAASEDGSAQERGRVEEKAHEESIDHEFDQQQYTDPAAVAQTPTPPLTPIGSAAGIASGGSGSAWLPPGASGELSNGAIPLPAATGAQGGSDSSAGLTGSTARVLAVSTSQQDAGADTTGTSAGDKAKVAAGTEAQSKPASGADFQAILGQAGRARQTGQLLRPTATPADSNADAAKQPIDIDSAAGPGDLARVLRSKVGARHSNMMIQLDPPELGRVRVDVRMHDEVMTVRFEAQTQAGHDALQGRLRELTGTLEQQGIRLDRVEVEFRPPPDTQQDGQSSSQDGGQQWRDPQFTGDDGRWQDPSQASSFNGASSAEGFAASAGPQTQAGILSASGVDVVV